MTDNPENSKNLDRTETITRHLYSKGHATIQEMTDLTGASEATIRRDLTQLVQDGVISRTHGGARIAQSSDERLGLKMREAENIQAKRDIAETAYEIIRPNTSIFLDNGTTVLQLARRIRIDPIPLTVFTDGLKVALELVDIPQLDVVLIGGALRSANLSCTGPLAETMLEGLRFDHLFLGAGGIGEDACIYSLHSAGASMNVKMMHRTKETHVLTDASKFGVNATYRIAPLTDVDSVVTNEGLSTDWRNKLADARISLCIAGASSRPKEEEAPAPTIGNRK